MVTILSRSRFCQNVYESVVTPIPINMHSIIKVASGINLREVYVSAAGPPLTLVLYNGRHLQLSEDTYNFKINILNTETSLLIVNEAAVVMTTDENDDPVFQYEWQYGDTASAGKYEAQVFGELKVDGKRIFFDSYSFTMREPV